MLVTTDSKSQYVYPFLGKAVIGRASYLDNLFGKNKKLIGFAVMIWNRGGAPSSNPRTFRFYQRGYRDHLDFGRDCAEIRGSLIGILSQVHPDRHPDHQAEAKAATSRVNQAHDVRCRHVTDWTQ